MFQGHSIGIMDQALNPACGGEEGSASGKPASLRLGTLLPLRELDLEAGILQIWSQPF